MGMIRTFLFVIFKRSSSDCPLFALTNSPRSVRERFSSSDFPPSSILLKSPSVTTPHNLPLSSTIKAIPAGSWLIASSNSRIPASYLQTEFFIFQQAQSIVQNLNTDRHHPNKPLM